MKRLIYMVLVLTLFLVGCSKKQETPLTLPEQFDNSGKRVIYWLEDGKKIPISIAIDGKKQLENGVYWYYELDQLCDFEATEDFCLYDVQSKLPVKKVRFDALNKETGYAINGEWPTFFAPIHTEYGKDNQTSVDKTLIETARRLLDSNKREDTELIITDVWNFDLDGDDVEERFFRACNCDTLGEGSAGYCILGYLDGEVCQTLYGNYSIDSNKKKISVEPLICDPNGDGIWKLFVYKNGDYKSVSSFDFEGGTFSRSYEIVF